MFSCVLALLGAMCLFLTACTAPGGDVPPGAVGTAAPPGAATDGGGDALSAGGRDSSFMRTPPEVKMPQFGGDNQQARDSGGQSAVMDLTYLNEGYVGVQCVAGATAKFRIAKGDAASSNERDDYDLDTDGATNFFPITRGDGQYTFVVYVFLYEEAGMSYYDPFLTVQGAAAVASEQAPYSVPTKLARYTPESDCVQLSYEIAQHAQSNLEVVQDVYNWMAENIEYDYDKATEIGGQSVIYEPLPDRTLEEGKGICYDYASLAAAMLRANGIPTALVKGDVVNPQGETIIHAWNLVWLEETGWIVAGISVNPNDWTQIDVTFAATASAEIAGQWVGDGEHYTPTSMH